MRKVTIAILIAILLAVVMYPVYSVPTCPVGSFPIAVTGTLIDSTSGNAVKDTYMAFREIDVYGTGATDLGIVGDGDNINKTDDNGAINVQVCITEDMTALQVQIIPDITDVTFRSAFDQDISLQTYVPKSIFASMASVFKVSDQIVIDSDFASTGGNMTFGETLPHETDSFKIFSEILGTEKTRTVLEISDDIEDDLVIRHTSANSNPGSIDILTAKRGGVDITGTLTANKFQGAVVWRVVPDSQTGESACTSLGGSGALGSEYTCMFVIEDHVPVGSDETPSVSFMKEGSIGGCKASYTDGNDFAFCAKV